LEYRLARMGHELLVMSGRRHHQTNNAKTV
jgi:hypothetical protein